MGDGCIVRIEKLTNGYEVEIRDQKEAEKNRKSNSDPKAPYRYVDPWKSFAFKTEAEVVAFLGKNLSKASPDNEFSHSFDVAAAEDDD
jgi:hypothetical protein